MYQIPVKDGKSYYQVAHFYIDIAPTINENNNSDWKNRQKETLIEFE